jgi:hypothetical protein
MSSLDKNLSKKNPSKLVQTADDDNWTDLAPPSEKTVKSEKTPSPGTPSHEVAQPESKAAEALVPHLVGTSCLVPTSSGGAKPVMPSPPFLGHYPLMTPHDVHHMYGPQISGSPAPVNYSLESELRTLANHDIGLLNAVQLLTKELSPEMYASQCHKVVTRQAVDSSLPVHLKSVFERQSLGEQLVELGYILGLKRSIKILRSAAEKGDDFVNWTISYRSMASQNMMRMVPPTSGVMASPSSISMVGPPVPMPSFSNPSMDAKLKDMAKDIVKETIKEYKGEIVALGTEALQKEMIQLCRDVSLTAMDAVKGRDTKSTYQI